MEMQRVRRNYNKRVLWRGTEYILVSCVESRDENTGELKHRARLKDIKARSSYIEGAEFEDLEEITL